VGQDGILRPSGTRPAFLSTDIAYLWLRLAGQLGKNWRVGNPPQDAILPHTW